MSCPSLKWLGQARRDLAEIIEYIADDNPDAARELKTEVIERARLLLTHPRLYRPGKLPGTREMVIRRNYIIVYVETPETVTVLRVLHAAVQWP